MTIGYLAKRLNAATVQETKTFFRIEVNKYVERLLANKQVFKAERVLSNVNVNAKLYFYEFYESCDDSEVRGVIINYLKKVLGDEYEREHLQMTTELKALKMVKCDEALRTKYPDAISLEQFKGLDVQIQKELLSEWDLDDEMISLVKIHESHLPDYVLNSLARRSIFMENELENVDLLVQRLTSSGSMTANIQMLKSRPYSLKIIKSILDRNLHQFLIEDFVEVNDLIEIAPQYPQYQDEIELCVDLKKVELSNTAAISSMISKYLKKKNPDFDKEHPLVNLVEIFLQKNASIDALSPDEFKEIPLLKTILQKFQSSGDRNDFHVTLQDLVKRFESVDLNSIKADAGGEELNFSNPSMFETRTK
ncbi:hypothetical protein Bhyg_09050 [Pseudolycoriella hygida]|uniref:Uncharacterized protein n=1 Tax=Pseudolycoriella hygida TaxID=35572 RepID=A0A9Q0S436_9DIPT|nr:hypothetical protein Bhyg_09050 [Pseudolycoriella hygida]